MKTFEDLKFEEHEKAILDFPNGYGVIVLFGSLFYSNGIDTYDLAVLKDGKLCYDTDITNDVMGWLSKDEVTEVMEKVQNLPK